MCRNEVPLPQSRLTCHDVVPLGAGPSRELLPYPSVGGHVPSIERPRALRFPGPERTPFSDDSSTCLGPTSFGRSYDEGR